LYYNMLFINMQVRLNSVFELKGEVGSNIPTKFDTYIPIANVQ